MVAIKPLDVTNPYTYEEYKDLIITLAENSGSTGDNTEEHIAATKINAQRFKRIDKHCVLNPDLIRTLNDFKINCLWLVLAESWCGDGAQCIPVLEKMAEQSPCIEMKLILRDENPEVMDAHLTNGCKSIPKLVCIDKKNGKEIGSWGPRPKGIQKMVVDFKQNHPESTHQEFVNNLHLWYARDKTKFIQDEFVELLDTWNFQL